MEKVNAVCSACGGTGLYKGMCEQEGHPVVCINCNGTGCEEIKYNPFVEIKKISGVKGVRLSRGTFIVTGVGGVGKEVSYDEFLAGKLKYR